MKTTRDLQKSLKNFTDEELKKELNRRHNRRLGKVLGYRAFLSGDEYKYGEYSDYLIGETRDLLCGGYKNMTKEQAKELAENAVKRNSNGGYVQAIYKHNLKYTGRRVE